MASLGYVKLLRRWRVRWKAKARNTPCIFKGSKVFHEKAQAVKFYAEIEAQERLIRSGQVVPSESLSVVVDNYLKHIKKHTQKTQQHYGRVIGYFLKSLPKSVIRIHQLEVGHIQEYLYRLRDRGVINRTINAHLTVIKSLCRYVSERFSIPNPAGKVKLLKEDPPNSRFLIKEEYHKLLDIAPPLAKHRLIFLAHTGLRASEFSQLSPDCISPQATTITIIGKGRRTRTIPLNKTAKSVLHHIEPASKNALYLQFSRLAKRAGIEKFGPHALRHYCATQLLINGVPAALVSKIMGVSVRVIEKHYAHILTADIANVTDVLDE